MGGLFNAINTSKLSLEVNQKSIEVVGNNISNINTEGYSRQEAVLEPYPSLNFGGFFIGQGVRVSDVSRQHDVFIEKQIMEKSVDFGKQDAMTLSLSKLESLFNISDDNLSANIDVFFDSLQKLSTDPSDPVLRNNVLLQGNALSTKFNSIVNDLNSIKDNINETLDSKLETVNSEIQQIADLNERVYSIEVNGQTANAARDQRDVLAKSLATTLGAQTYEDSNGMLTVHLPGGLPLVQGDMAMSISSVVVGSSMELELHAGGVTRRLGVNNLGGEFQGLIEIRDNFIPDLHADIDKIAYELSVQVNLQHQKGGDLDSGTGNIFFNIPPNYVASPPAPTAAEYDGAARNMGVALTDPNKIAAGAAPDPGPPAGTVAPGDNTNVLILSNIADTYLIDGNQNFNSLYATIAARVGSESNQNQLSYKGAEDALIQLQNFRDGLVGVSLEEEMISLIRFQRGFESSAKFLSTVDEMMETLINIR
jgi:flagellar hook-associated protein 1 FlgK